MSIKKKLLMGLLTLLMAASIVMGVIWNRQHYVLVDLHFYPKNEKLLDLRGEQLPAQRYDKLKEKLPGCEILWDVPLSGGSVSSDAETVTLTALTGEDVVLLDHLRHLQTVEAKTCQDYEALLTLEQRRPELDIRYQVALGNDSFDRSAEEITVRGVTTMELNKLDNMKSLKRVICAGGETSAVVGLREACAQRNIDFAILVGEEILDQKTEEVSLENVTEEETFLLAGMPKLKKLHLIRPQATAEELRSLKENNPQMDITWEMELFGALCSSNAEELDLSGAEITRLSQLQEAMAWFPEAEQVFLGDSGVDNETLASWREEVRGDYKLVWTVQCGSLEVRTDDTTFMPVRENVYYFNDEEAYNLRYCEDMVCIDIGHMSIHNIDFVEYMPNLEYLILAHTQLNYIDPISSCKKLKFLELDWSPIRDLSPLVGCTALEDLNLGNTYASFEPIKQMTWLKNLWVIGCSTGTAYRMSQALPDTKVQGAGNATVASGWRDLENYYDMRDLLGMHYMSW